MPTSDRSREIGVEEVTVQYDESFEPDLARVTSWIRRAVMLRSSKYGLSSYHPPVRLHLHRAPTPRADPHQTRYGYWGDRPMAEIDVLTPSAEAWSTAGRSLAGLHCDHDDNREKNLVHEFTHAVQLTVWREPRDRSYPIWWVEGLPEFDGLFHTTLNNRTDAVAGLWPW